MTYSLPAQVAREVDLRHAGPEFQADNEAVQQDFAALNHEVARAVR